MTKNKDPNKESLAEIAVDPDVLARELALEIEIDPVSYTHLTLPTISSV